MEAFDVVVIGTGAAGLTAAIYTARANLKPVLIHGMQPGGQMTITTDVENYPGFADVIQGPWLMEQMQLQAEHVGTEMISDQIVEADLKSRPFKLTADSGDIYTCDALIICTGVVGRSRPSTGVVSIFFTTSMPFTTLPNTGWRDCPGVNQSR